MVFKPNFPISLARLSSQALVNLAPKAVRSINLGDIDGTTRDLDAYKISSTDRYNAVQHLTIGYALGHALGGLFAPGAEILDQRKLASTLDAFEPLDLTVDELELSTRTRNCMDNANLRYIGELVQRTPENLLRTKNLGKKSLAEVDEKLEKLGLRLGMILYWRAPHSSFLDYQQRHFNQLRPEHIERFVAAFSKKRDARDIVIFRGVILNDQTVHHVASQLNMNVLQLREKAHHIHKDFIAFTEESFPFPKESFLETLYRHIPGNLWNRHLLPAFSGYREIYATYVRLYINGLESQQRRIFEDWLLPERPVPDWDLADQLGISREELHKIAAEIKKEFLDGSAFDALHSLISHHRPSARIMRTLQMEAPLMPDEELAEALGISEAHVALLKREIAEN